MPLAKKFQREDIIRAACEVVRMEGLEGLNARRVARELSASVQPIFHNFASMGELRSAVLMEIYNVFKGCLLSGIHKEMPYKQIGLSYIRFAIDYPQFFKILFMSSTDRTVENSFPKDSLTENIIKSGQKMTGFSYEEMLAFHRKVWIFTHGIATLAATGTINFTEEEIDELLEVSVAEMVWGHMYKKQGGIDKNGKCNRSKKSDEGI